MSGDTTPKPDFEGFARAILEQWPTSDIDGADLFELSVSYGMISEVPGGYDPEHHIDAEGICPERGDPWYEYTFRGEAGPGPYSVLILKAQRDALQAKLAMAVEALGQISNRPYEAIWGEAHEHTEAMRAMEDLADVALAKLTADTTPAPEVSVGVLLRKGVGREAIDAAFKSLPADAYGTIAEGEMERVILAALRALAGDTDHD